MNRSRRLLCAWTLVVTCAGPCASTARADDAATPIVVRGTERILWEQAGDTASLEFRVYVDGVQTDAAAACENLGEELACSAPLPFIADGVHTITLTAVSRVSGLESPPSEPVVVIKLPTGPPSEWEAAARRRPARATSSDSSGTRASATTDGPSRTPAVTLLVRDLEAPVDVAAIGDGRLLVGEASGIVRMLDATGAPTTDGASAASLPVALDTRTWLRPTPDGPLGFAVDPQFTRNHFAYIAFVATGTRDDVRLQIVRLREVAGTLGEPATLFDIPVVHTQKAAVTQGPRVSFGPDALLYVALPRGLVFDGLPSASAPAPTIARVALDGRALADVVPLQGVGGHVRAFGWDTATGALWALVDAGDTITLRRLTTPDAARAATDEAPSVLLPAAPSDTPTTMSLVIIAATSPSVQSRAYVSSSSSGLIDVFRLGEPITRGESFSPADVPLARLIAGPDGTLLAVTTRRGQVLK